MGNQMVCCVKEREGESNYNKKQKKQLLRQKQRNGPLAQQQLGKKNMSEEYYFKATGTNLKQSQDISNKSANNLKYLSKNELSSSSNQISEKQLRQNRVSQNSQFTNGSGEEMFYSIVNSQFQSNIGGGTLEMSTNQQKKYSVDEIDSSEEQSYNENLTFGQNTNIINNQQQKSALMQDQRSSSDINGVITQTEEEDLDDNVDDEEQQNTDISEREKEYNLKVEKISQLFEKNVPLDSELTKWKHFQKKGTATCYICSEDDTGMFACRVEDQIRINDLQQFIEDTYDFEARKKIDGMFEGGTNIEFITKYINISHQIYKGVAIVAARDVILLQGKVEKEDGTLMLMAQSVEDDRYPETQKPVRAEVQIAGWHVKKIEGSDNVYNVVYLSKLNAKGKIPMYIKKGTAKFPIDMLKKLKAKWEKK